MGTSIGKSGGWQGGEAGSPSAEEVQTRRPPLPQQRWQAIIQAFPGSGAHHLQRQPSRHRPVLCAPRSSLWATKTYQPELVAKTPKLTAAPFPTTTQRVCPLNSNHQE